MEPRAIAAIRMEWDLVAHTSRSRRLLAEIAAVEPDIARLGVTDLAVLLEVTSGRRGTVPESTVHGALAALVRQFDRGQLVGITLVRALLPGLARVAMRMRWGAAGPWNDREEFAADLVGSAWRHLREHAGETLSRPCQTIVDQVRRSLRTDQERHWRTSARCLPWDPARPEPADRGVDALTELAFGLELVAGTVLAPSDASLLLANRVLGYGLAELADVSGQSVAQLSYRRRCAERALAR